jgi:hypothetical protein
MGEERQKAKGKMQKAKVGEHRVLELLTFAF